MIIKFKKSATVEQIQASKNWLIKKEISFQEIDSDNYTLLLLIGDTSHISIDTVQALEGVAEVRVIQEQYKLASRTFNQYDTIITLDNGVKIGGENFLVMAGPCSVESEEQIMEIAKSVKKSGANVLRGGAFKPRTSPYSFQGMGVEGLKLLEIAKKETGLAIVSEIMEASQLKYFENVDILQVGTRNMQNFELLKELGKIDKPVLLKRGLSATYQELLMSAEYILAGGNKKVILCERGIRTFETGTRNTLDITAIPYLKMKSHLPVIADPSHAAGLSQYVESLSMASTVSGANGLIIEVHNDPKNALSDGAQSITPIQFDLLMKKIVKLRKVILDD